MLSFSCTSYLIRCIIYIHRSMLLIRDNLQNTKLQSLVKKLLSIIVKSDTFTDCWCVMQNKEQGMPVPGMAAIPPGISRHHRSHDGDTAKYRQKYRKLKQLVKETIFVSDKHFYSIFLCKEDRIILQCMLSFIDITRMHTLSFT